MLAQSKRQFSHPSADLSQDASDVNVVNMYRHGGGNLHTKVNVFLTFIHILTFAPPVEGFLWWAGWLRRSSQGSSPGRPCRGRSSRRRRTCCVDPRDVCGFETIFHHLATLYCYQLKNITPLRWMMMMIIIIIINEEDENDQQLCTSEL